MRSKLLCISALLFALPVAAQEVRTVAISKGVEAWAITQPSVPMVDVKLAIEGAGSAGDPAGKEGRARFAALMLSEGAGELSSLAFKQALEDHAITLQFDAEKDRLVVHIRALREHAEKAGELLALALSSPRLDAADAARIKNVMQSRRALLEEDPDYLAARALEATGFAGHAYAREAEGTASSIAALGVADVKEYLATQLTRAQLTIVAAGDVNNTLLTAMLAPVVNALPEGKTLAPTPMVTMQKAGEDISVPRDLSQRTVHFMAPAISRADPKFYAFYLLNHALGGHGLTSRLADILRQQQGLVYGIGTKIDILNGGVFLRGAFASRNETSDQAESLVKATLAEIAARGLSERECEAARAYVRGSFPLEMDGTDALSSMLMSMRRYHLGKDYLEKRNEYFKNVSCATVNDLAKELLDPKRFLFVTVGPQPKETP